MKRLIALFLSLMLPATMLAGCIPSQEEPENTTQAPISTQQQTSAPETTVQTSPEPVQPQLPLICVSITQTAEQTLADDGAAVHEYIYPTMLLTLPDGELAESITLDLMNQVDATRSAAQNSADMAKAAYTGEDGWVAFFDQVNYTPMRVDTSVLSLYSRQITYTGAAHPEFVSTALNYDLSDGSLLNLRDILISGITADTLCRLVVDALEEISGEVPLYDDYMLTVEDRFAGDFGGDRNWYFTGTGLCFYFPEYEVAPYSAGIVLAEIPYDQLAGVIKDDYFPAEKVSSEGALLSTAFEETELNTFSRFAESSTGTEGGTALLYTDSLIYDVTVEVGSWSAGGSTFTPERTIFAAHLMSASDALVIQGVTRNTLPPVRVSYANQEGIHYAYLTFSNSGDSSVVLIDPMA